EPTSGVRAEPPSSLIGDAEVWADIRARAPRLHVPTEGARRLDLRGTAVGRPTLTVPPGTLRVAPEPLARGATAPHVAWLASDAGASVLRDVSLFDGVVGLTGSLPDGGGDLLVVSDGASVFARLEGADGAWSFQGEIGHEL